MGTILKTTDGGTNWTLRTSNTSNNLLSLYFVNESLGWVTGNYGTILNTADGGENWMALTSGTSSNLTSVYFLNENLGWTVGSLGAILKTEDSGGVWTFQSGGTSNNLTSIQLIDENSGWAAGNNGTILKTTDGGGSWVLQDGKMNYDLTSVCFTDLNTGWTAGKNGTILHTTNGGITYADVKTNGNSTPKEFYLLQNYPNPFNPNTRIQFAINSEELVTLKIYDVLGNEIETLVNETKPAGEYQFIWEANKLASGVYFYRLQAGDFISTKKMILQK